MIEKAKEFCNSLLTNYSKLHIVQYKMYNAYLTWFEQNHTNKIN
jgi:hypothetical protein